MEAAAIRLCSAVKYCNAATCEFIYDLETVSGAGVYTTGSTMLSPEKHLLSRSERSIASGTRRN